MKLLALDTSTLACAVGALVNDRIASRYEEQPREHTKLLVPMIRDVLTEADITLQELDAIVLGNGPGSFIGMRIAASVAQGLAFGAQLDIVPVSSMAALAMDAGQPGDRVVVAQDAHMQQVYLGLYFISEDGLANALAPERLQSLAEIPELAGSGNAIAAGAGWQRYPMLRQANSNAMLSNSDALYPSPGALLTLGAALCRQGELVAPRDVSPAYLREKVAQEPQPGTS